MTDNANEPSPSEDEDEDSPRAASVKTLGLSMVLAGVAAILLAFTYDAPVSANRIVLTWLAIAAASAMAELLVFHVEIRGEAHTFTLSEIPLILGLLFASPITLLVGRLTGEFAILVLRDRQRSLKLVFNTALFAVECSVAMTVFTLLPGDGDVSRPSTWIAVAAAITAADALTASAVATVIGWHGGQPNHRQLLMFAGVTAVTNTSIGLVASILLVVLPWATLLLGVVALIVFVGYRSYARLTQRYANLSQLYEFTRIVSGAFRAERVIESILTEALGIMRARTGEIVLLAPDGRSPGLRLHLDIGGGLSTESINAGSARALVDGAAPRGEVVIERRGLRRWSRRDRRLGANDSLAAALLSDGQLAGSFVVRDRLGEVSTFDDADAQLFGTLANHASVALENSRLVDRLLQQAREREHEALHDALTGLPNRTKFLRELQAVLDRAPSQCAVMIMDLDRFKEINDTLGHHAGDELLQQIGVRLQDAVGEAGTVARLGGDEFALLLPGAGERDTAIEAAARVREALHAPFRVGDANLELAGSTGIALSPEHGSDVVALLQHADVAMYEAKAGEGIAVYEPSSDANSARRFAVTSALRRAIETGELYAYFQPKARLRDGVVIGVEALARWNHPTLGTIGPDEFIPIAEQTGLIPLLTDQILDAALALWRRAHDEGHDLHVAVNLSVRSLLDSALPDHVADRLAAYGVPADGLTLEITESSIMGDPIRAQAVLDRLAALGTRIAIDDFGTGYSSLGYLHRLPADEVKIDKSFVMSMTTDMGSEAIVRSIISLGRSLRLDVVAEGIENVRTWEALREMDCDVAQRFYLSPPLSADGLLAFLSAVPAWQPGLPAFSSSG